MTRWRFLAAPVVKPVPRPPRPPLPKRENPPLPDLPAPSAGGASATAVSPAFADRLAMLSRALPCPYLYGSVAPTFGRSGSRTCRIPRPVRVEGMTDGTDCQGRTPVQNAIIGALRQRR